MLVKVLERSSISVVPFVMKRVRIEASVEEVDVARTCWTFFAPASWVRIVGHLMAFERSIWRRPFQAVEFE